MRNHNNKPTEIKTINNSVFYLRAGRYILKRPDLPAFCLALFIFHEPDHPERNCSQSRPPSGGEDSERKKASSTLPGKYKNDEKADRIQCEISPSEIHKQRQRQQTRFIDLKSFDEHITVGANLISAHSPELGDEHEIALKVRDASAAESRVLQLGACARASKTSPSLRFDDW